MSNKEYSAVDAIYIILEKINNMSERISLMDNNIKELNNKVYVLNSRISKLKKENNKKIINNNYTASEPKENSGLILGKVKLYGYIKNSAMQPIKDVCVEVKRGSEKIRTIYTDKEGYWEARLPTGSYRVIYSHNRFKPVGKDVLLNEGVSEFEVK